MNSQNEIPLFLIKINNLFINNQIKINKYLFINIYNILYNINKINICTYKKSNIIYKKILNYPKMYLNFNKKRNFNKNLFYWNFENYIIINIYIIYIYYYI